MSFYDSKRQELQYNIETLKLTTIFLHRSKTDLHHPTRRMERLQASSFQNVVSDSCDEIM